MMKWVPVLLAIAACAGAPAPASSTAAPSRALAYLESLPDMDGAALPPRADAPRTVVMFFASW